MIPKLIHYCWFGGNPLPDKAKKCIDSWKRFFPGYEIIEWNESNFNVDDCAYAREAYDAKQWAFVSDYARFWILYNYGGFYFDTDVEVIKSFDDIIDKGPYLGLEKKNALNPGLGLAFDEKNPVIKDLLDGYAKRHFLQSDGSFNQCTIVPYTTSYFKKRGLKSEDTLQNILGITIYPSNYFCPLNYDTGNLKLTENTYSIHHYHASWHSEQQKYAYNLQKKLVKIMPIKLAEKVAHALSILKYQGVKELFAAIRKKKRDV